MAMPPKQYAPGWNDQRISPVAASRAKARFPAVDSTRPLTAAIGEMTGPPKERVQTTCPSAGSSAVTVPSRLESGESRGEPPPMYRNRPSNAAVESEPSPDCGDDPSRQIGVDQTGPCARWSRSKA